MHMVIYKVINYSVGPNVSEIAYRHNDTNNGFNWHKRTTCVLEVCMIWKYRSTYWFSMKDTIYLHPVELDEYVSSANIQH